jgi:hypothetical protein
MTFWVVSLSARQRNIDPRQDGASLKEGRINIAKLAFTSLAIGQDKIGMDTASAD